MKPAGLTLFWEGTDWLSRLTDGGIAWFPRGVATDGSAVYILEVLQVPALVADLIGSPRIRRIEPDGSSRLVASIASAPLRLGVATAVALLIAAVVAWRRRYSRMGMTT
jgi:hypothetical protein